MDKSPATYFPLLKILVMSHYRRKMGCEGNSCRLDCLLAHIILIKLNICQFTWPKKRLFLTDIRSQFSKSHFSNLKPTHLIYLLVSLFVYLKLPHFGWLFNLAHIFIFNYTTIQKLGIRENFFLNNIFSIDAFKFIKSHLIRFLKDFCFK